MEKYFEVMSRVLELTETMLEGLQYMQVQLNQGKLEEAFEMLRDVMTGIYSVEESLQPILKRLPENQIEDQKKKLNNALTVMLDAYEMKNGARALEIMQFNLLPSYKNWQMELSRCLNPYVVS